MSNLSSYLCEGETRYSVHTVLHRANMFMEHAPHPRDAAVTRALYFQFYPLTIMHMDYIPSRPKNSLQIRITGEDGLFMKEFIKHFARLTRVQVDGRHDSYAQFGEDISMHMRALALGEIYRLN